MWNGLITTEINIKHESDVAFWYFNKGQCVTKTMIYCKTLKLFLLYRSYSSDFKIY